MSNVTLFVKLNSFNSVCKYYSTYYSNVFNFKTKCIQCPSRWSDVARVSISLWFGDNNSAVLSAVQEETNPRIWSVLLLFVRSSCMQWGEWVRTVGHLVVQVKVTFCSWCRWVFFLRSNSVLEEILSCNHSRKPDLPAIHSFPMNTRLSVFFFFALSANPALFGPRINSIGSDKVMALLVATVYCHLNWPTLDFFQLYWNNNIWSVGCIFLIFFVGHLKPRFTDVKPNPGQRRPVPTACRILCSDLRGLSKKFSDLTVAYYQYDILL